MRTLILSCNTGAGHNSCARAMQECCRRHGDICDITDALQFISRHTSEFISNWHTRIYLHAPKVFSAGYGKAEEMSDGINDLFREGTPLYRYITAGAERMYRYILRGYDNIICTHVFAALALTEVLRRHPEVHLTTSLISTDYTCTPCTADSHLDRYFLPAKSLQDEFVRCGVPKEKLAVGGIPVRQEFYAAADREKCREALGIRPEQSHLIMMCGSMGCGPMEEITQLLGKKMGSDDVLSVICGKNETLYRKLQQEFGQTPNIRILGQVDDMPLWMHGADVFLTKPGGLSTSEAAAAALPMVLIDAVAGCEEHNLHYFLNVGAAVTGDTPEQIADAALSLAHDEKRLSDMRQALRSSLSAPADEEIYDCLKGLTPEETASAANVSEGAPRRKQTHHLLRS